MPALAALSYPRTQLTLMGGKPSVAAMGLRPKRPPRAVAADVPQMTAVDAVDTRLSVCFCAKVYLGLPIPAGFPQYFLRIGARCSARFVPCCSRRVVSDCSASISGPSSRMREAIPEVFSTTEMKNIQT